MELRNTRVNQVRRRQDAMVRNVQRQERTLQMREEERTRQMRERRVRFIEFATSLNRGDYVPTMPAEVIQHQLQKAGCDLDPCAQRLIQSATKYYVWKLLVQAWHLRRHSIEEASSKSVDLERTLGADCLASKPQLTPELLAATLGFFKMESRGIAPYHVSPLD